MTLDLDGNAASVKLRTQQLVMSLGGVSSKAADEATGNLWSADVGLPDDNLPEVPPGGEHERAAATGACGGPNARPGDSWGALHWGKPARPLQRVPPSAPACTAAITTHPTPTVHAPASHPTTASHPPSTSPQPTSP